MEKRLKRKIDNYMRGFKENIREQCKLCGISNNPQYNDFLQYLYDYPPLEITKEDMSKRKRVKNTVPLHERCCALRANNEQCTRRKKEGELYCGTHIKGRPHGEVNGETTFKSVKKKEVWAEDIQGIIYYIDADGNVYDHNDIMNGTVDPRIIAKYIKTIDGYHIPSLFKK